MKNKKIKHIIQAIILTALAVVSQVLLEIIPRTIIFGVNLKYLVPAIFISLILVIGACCFSFSVATTVALITPIAVFLLSLSLTKIPVTILTDVISNFFLIFYIWICVRASKGLKKVSATLLQIVGVFTGACLKMLIANVITNKVVIVFFEISKKGADIIYNSQSNELFIGTLMGGLLAILISPVIKRAFNTK